MRLLEPGELRSDLANPIWPPLINLVTTIAGFGRKTVVIAELEVRKLRHEPTDLLTWAVQPAPKPSHTPTATPTPTPISTTNPHHHPHPNQHSH